MTWATYYGNIVNSAATDASNSAVTTMSQLVSLSIEAQLELITDQSDGSPVPTIYDVARKGYRWRAMTRDAEAANKWCSLGFLKSASFALHDMQSSTSSEIVLTHVGVDEMRLSARWGTIAEWVIGGLAARATMESTTFEGAIDIRDALSAVNWQFEGDMISRLQET